MEFKNISDEKSASTIRNVNVVKSMRSLSENLLAGMKEKNLSGLGIYLKVKLRKGGSSDVNVKIPFFLVPKKSSNFLNLNGVNKVNPLAIKLMKKWQGKNAAAFDLDVDYKNPKLAEIATQIAALGATPDPAALAALTDKQTAVNALQDKDTENVIKDLIDDLEDKLSKKLDLSTYPDAASKALRFPA